MSKPPAEEPTEDLWSALAGMPDAPAPAVPNSAPNPRRDTNLEEIDSGDLFQACAAQYVARIQQLKSALHHSARENDSVIDDYLLQNLELIALNQNLERKVQECTRELEQANDKLQELAVTKESLMHMIVHDLKNPLTAILGTLRLFQPNPFGLAEDPHGLLMGAHEHAKKLLSMIEDILVISRMQTREFVLKPEPVDLWRVAESSVALMRQTLSEKRIAIRLVPETGSFPAVVDVQTIDRVICNLLNNALKYSPTGEEIVVGLEYLERQVEIRVANAGEPIPPEHHQRIFQTFSRVNPKDAKFSGTGLGLAFCRLAAEAHGGSIRVVSPRPDTGTGTLFLVRLPASGASAL